MIAAAIVLRRAAISTLLLLLLTVATFAIFFAIPADPGRVFFGTVPVSDERLAEANHALGTDRPKVEQYLDYFWHLVQGDLGTSWLSASIDPDGKLVGTPVSTTLVPSLGVTGSLVVGGAVLLLLIALPLGILSASRPNSWLDRTAMTVALVAISTHPIVVGLLLRVFAADHLGLPTSGYCSLFAPPGGAPPASTTIEVASEPCGGALDWASHLVLPCLTFALLFVALYMRMIRTRLLDVLGEPYVRTARAKGVPEWRVLGSHALRNAISPVVTMLAMDIGVALGVAIYVESVFSLPGLGSLSLHALSADRGYDRPMIVAIVLVTGVAIVVLNLLADLVVAAIDPRFRLGSATRSVLAPFRQAA